MIFYFIQIKLRCYKLNDSLKNYNKRSLMKILITYNIRIIIECMKILNQFNCFKNIIVKMNNK